VLHEYISLWSLKFVDLKWGEFGVPVLRLLFKSVNYKINYLYILPLCYDTLSFSCQKLPRFETENYCPGMKRKQCDVCISSLFLLWCKL
jgi:hypothetical protein